MKPGDIIGGAYVLGERLGKNPFGQTWAAVAGDACVKATPGTELVLKAIVLAEAPDWKALELIEREAGALKSMSHPAVPRYVDSFRLDEGESPTYVLVMERMPGRSLADEVGSGKRFTENEIERLVADILDILAYIHSLRPPIIHRDVNPKNLVLRPDGSIALVDFSGVQDAVMLAYRDTSTMIGTAGYAPLEQVSGRATVRSDLYAAAATAAFLLTRKHPSDLPVSGMRIDPGAVVELSPRLAFVLRSYLDPDEAKRSLPPSEAAAILRGLRPVPAGDSPSSRLPAAGFQGIAERFAERISGSLEARIRESDAPEPVFGNERGNGAPLGRTARTPEGLPSDSRVTLSSDPKLLSLSIPAGGLRSPGFWASGGFAVFWLGFVAFWTFSAITMGAPIFFAMFSLPFWAVGLVLVRLLVKPALTSVSATLSKEGGLVFEERFLGRSRIRTWQFSDLGDCRLENAAVSQNGRHEREVVIEAGAKTVRLGRTLSERERRAIASAVASWLDAARTQVD